MEEYFEIGNDVGGIKPPDGWRVIEPEILPQPLTEIAKDWFSVMRMAEQLGALHIVSAVRNDGTQAVLVCGVMEGYLYPFAELTNPGPPGKASDAYRWIGDLKIEHSGE
jgi:hypothetical protein